jgi:formylglycine-generating enzyme required for sulfatase activity/Cdc6-like AAA superfamily ATPase
LQVRRQYQYLGGLLKMADKSDEVSPDELEKFREEIRKAAPVERDVEPRQPSPILEQAASSGGNWSDHEILTESQDWFSTQDYANVLADRVATADTPLTIGIFGRWGSGKTSLMKLIEVALTEEKNEEEKNDRGLRRFLGRLTEIVPLKKKDKMQIHRIWINVWQLNNQEEVWHAFLQALFSKVYGKQSLWRRIDYSKLPWQLIKYLFWVVLAISPILAGLLIAASGVDSLKDPKSGLVDLNRVPEYVSDNWQSLIQGNFWATSGALLTFGLIFWVLSKVKEAIKAIQETARFDLKAVLQYGSYEVQITELMRLQQHFEKMINALVGKDGRLVVFIDDLDRCTPDKVPEVLEAIKLFSTTKRCVYVLGLDYDIVRQGIELKYGFKTKADAEEYLEKIVQIPFHMPPLDVGKIKEFVRVNYPNLPQRGSTASEVFSEGLDPNPRKVKRALNIYRTLLELAKERWDNWEIDRQIDPELLAKMVVIQNRFRNLYEELIERSDLLIELEKAAREGLNLGVFARNERSTDLATELENPALGAMLKAGKKCFETLDLDDLSSYIFLTGTAKGSVTGVRPSSRERKALLGGDPEEIKNQVAEILNRGGPDEQAQQQSKQEYVKRLNQVLSDFERYVVTERVSANLALDQFEGWKRKAFEPETVRVPAGEFLMGSDPGVDKDAQSEEQPQHTVELPAYRIGRYPVTNAEYRHFVEAGGYTEQWRHCWTEAGWAKKEKQKWTEPRLWQKGKYNQPDQPVVGISWYEAVAYCRWLSEQTSRPYRLPTEAEWEKAARGSAGRIYPWGNAWDETKLNSEKGGPGRPTSVGEYSPEGDSPYGAADMAGNVFEWCATKMPKDNYKSYPYDVQENEWTAEYLEGTDVRVLRGGSWCGYQHGFRCAFRYRFS